MRFLKPIFFLLVSLFSLLSKAQNLGKHDSDINWKSIDTKNVKVIFPLGTDNHAKRIADVIDYIHDNATISVGEKSKKIDLVLQTQQTISNGFVTLSPYRSEFFAVSPQDQSALGTPEWLDLLAVHEYRHALQYANANRGFTKFLHIVAGQNGWAGGLGFSIPSWYLEGDAVLSETLLSENGRGRNPYFFKEQRALFLEDKIYSYHKAQNGSFKDIVPNIYPLGYMISNYIRNNYDIETGRKILADAGKYKYVVYPFSSAMKKHTKLTTTKMYKVSAKALKNEFKTESTKLNLTQSKSVHSGKPKTVTHYTFPHYLNDETIVAIKRSFNETPHIVLIKNEIEKKLTTIGIAAEEFLSVTNNKLSWTEHKKDLRHANNNYSDIVVYDLNKNSKKTITNKQRYFAPSFSNDASKILAVNYDENITYSIDVLDADSGKIISKIPNPSNYSISTPKWSHGDLFCIYLAKKNGRLAFFKYDFKLNQSIQISDWTANTIGQFTIGKSDIYFTASFSGIDNIYSIDLDGKRNLKMISSVKVGAYFPNVSKQEDKIIYSEFTTKGYKLHEQNLYTNFEPYVLPDLNNPNYFNIKTTVLEYSILDSIPKKEHNTKDYKSFKDTKLHSWGITTSTTSTSTLGVNVQFQNILNDFSGNLAYLYNLNENTGSIRALIGYGKGLLNWNFKTVAQDRNTQATVEELPGNLSFNETNFGGGFSIPLSQYVGNYSRAFNFETNYIQHITSDADFMFLDETFLLNNNMNFGAIESKITISNIRRMAYQNVAPRLGQYIQLSYYKSIEETTAEKINLNSIFYFPGISKNHSLNIVANWQKELLSNEFQYSDTFSYARGYTIYSNDEASKLSINYELPILYPDFGIWGLTYFKRIRLNIFYDTSTLATYEYSLTGTPQNPVFSANPVNINQNSYGGELIFDNNYFNVAPISLGLRQSMLLNPENNSSDKNHVFDFFLRIGF